MDETTKRVLLKLLGINNRDINACVHYDHRIMGEPIIVPSGKIFRYRSPYDGSCYVWESCVRHTKERYWTSSKSIERIV